MRCIAGVPLTGLRAVAAGSALLALLSLLLPSTPTYDPWSWLIWGREITHLALDTRSGPSWKPLPVAFTTLFGLVPSAAPDLWVAVARAGALAALACAFRVARILGGGSIVAGLVAALTLAVSTNFLRFSAVGDSEGLLVALMFAAVECHLRGRLRTALWLAFAAALLRPEAWPFAGLYALWLAWRDPSARPLVGGLTVAGGVLWFGPELWGSGDLLRAGSRARDPNPNALSFAAHPWWEVVKRAVGMVPWPAKVGFVAATVLAAANAAREARSRLLLILTAMAVAWLGIVAVMTEHGFSGNARYLIAPVALACVLGGVGWMRLAAMAGRTVMPAAVRRDGAGSAGPSRAPAIAAVIAVIVAAVLVIGPASQLPENVRAARNEARLMDTLDDALSLAGGPRDVLGCGAVTTGPFQVPALAWRLNSPIRRVTYMPVQPGIVFRAAPAPNEISGAPVIPLRGSRWQITGRTGPWQVVRACSSPRNQR